MKKKVVFLFGGPGAEHEVSVATAKSALPEFDDQFILMPVFIAKDGLWSYLKGYVDPPDAWVRAEDTMNKKGVPPEIALDYIEKEDPFVVFIGLHGQFGEDGTVQALLEANGLTFTGSDAEASALAIDKPKVLQLLQDECISVPEFLEVTAEMRESDMDEYMTFIGLPVVVLPADSGSSVGVTIVRDKQKLAQALAKAKAVSDRVLMTKYIEGREVSCGVLATSATELISLPPTELIPGKQHDFFDYDAKYLPGHTKEITPPDMDAETIERIKTLAKKVHHVVDADGYSRTDMIVAPDKTVYILEINTLPGLTATSILPQQAKAYGLSFRQLLTTICLNVDRSAKDYITAVP